MGRARRGLSRGTADTPCSEVRCWSPALQVGSLPRGGLQLAEQSCPWSKERWSRADRCRQCFAEF
eukprot:5968812-Prymnesium_polylepis.1